MQIQVTSVGDVVEKQSSKPNKFGKLSKYQQVEVQFLSNGRAGKRQIMSFNPNGVFDVLNAAQEGAEFEITTKQDGEYTNWDTATPISASVASKSNGAAKSEGTPAKGATAFKSTYETPEERAKKQIYIIRQSSIAQAVAFCSSNQQDGFDVEDVLSVAKQFEDHVFASTELEDERNIDLDVEVD
jgi:hypothetical protein